jgi:hypothetical protein
MQGARARNTGLWHLDLSQPSPPLGTPPITRSSLLSKDGRNSKVATSNPGSPTAPQLQTCLTAVGAATPQALVTFSHAALFSPALSTLTTALAKGFLLPMPGLTLATLHKYLPKSVATIKGHLNQIRKNLRSTKTLKPPITPDLAANPDDLSEAFPTSDDGNLPLTTAMQQSSPLSPLVKSTLTRLATFLLHLTQETTTC